MLILPDNLLRQIRGHGEEAYPYECCGVLLGYVEGETKRVVRVLPARNVSKSPANHYEIAPVELIRAERKARSAGMHILGFYHSHPDHPAEPSITDLTEAHWLDASYVITAIGRGTSSATRSYHLAGQSEESKCFQEEEIRIPTESAN
jgi:proteasome lid subunit RPN8/RPN11